MAVSAEEDFSTSAIVATGNGVSLKT